MFINDNKSTIKMYLRKAIDKIMTAVANRATSSHDMSGTYDSGTSKQMPMSYNKSKPHNRPSLPQEGPVSNEHAIFPEIPVSHDATTYMDHLPLHKKIQCEGKTGNTWPHASPGKEMEEAMKMRCNLL